MTFETDITADPYDETDAINAITHRLETGEYVDTELAEGVSLVWDTDPTPYLVISPDSPYNVGEPDRRDIVDYGPTRDEIDQRLFDVLEAAVPDNGVPLELETEYDPANSSGCMYIFHVIGVYAFSEDI